MWIRCPQCKATVFRKEAEGRLMVCPECEYHFYLPARERIRQLLDQDSFEEWFTGLRPRDALEGRFAGQPTSTHPCWMNDANRRSVERLTMEG